MMRPRLPVLAAMTLILAACSAQTLPGSTSDVETVPVPTTASTTSLPSPTSSTSMPTTTTLTEVWLLQPSLFCRDLAALGYEYPDAALYWSLQRHPAQMDEDTDGIPCETAYSPADVTAFWGPRRATGPLTVQEVVAWVQKWLDDRFARAEPVEGVTGALRLECVDTGPVAVGDVFACAGVPRTEPGFPLDAVGVIIYVVDPAGPAAWSGGTDVPADSVGLRLTYGQAPKGLFCRDLLDPEIDAGIFSSSGRPPEDAFFYSMVYWSLEGMPERMDIDGDGIPCETLYDADDVAEILQGGPVPLFVRD